MTPTPHVLWHATPRQAARIFAGHLRPPWAAMAALLAMEPAPDRSDWTGPSYDGSGAVEWDLPGGVSVRAVLRGWDYRGGTFSETGREQPARGWMEVQVRRAGVADDGEGIIRRAWLQEPAFEASAGERAAEQATAAAGGAR